MDNVTIGNDLKTSATYGGYDPKIFLKPVNLDFMCSICNRKIKIDENLKTINFLNHINWLLKDNYIFF